MFIQVSTRMNIICKWTLFITVPKQKQPNCASSDWWMSKLCCIYTVDYSVQFSHLVVWLFATPWTTARQASLSITNSQGPPKPMFIESVMPSNHLILCRPLLLLPQPLPASESFPMSQLFTSGGQSTGVSALTSVLPTNTQDWLPLGWAGWISLHRDPILRFYSMLKHGV